MLDPGEGPPGEDRPPDRPGDGGYAGRGARRRPPARSPEKKELYRKIEQFESAQADWQAKAELAVPKGRDDLAKGALVAKGKAAEAAMPCKAELAQVEARAGQDQ